MEDLGQRCQAAEAVEGPDVDLKALGEAALDAGLQHGRQQRGPLIIVTQVRAVRPAVHRQGTVGTWTRGLVCRRALRALGVWQPAQQRALA